MADLVIRISGDAKKLSEEFDKVAAQTEDLENQLATAAKISGVAFAALTAEAVLATSAFAGQQAASNQLIQSLQNQGIASQELFDSYRTMADELERLTGVDDDAIVKGQALAQGFLGQIPITKELTAAALDLATKTGDVEQAFALIGRSVGGPTNALAKFGVEVDENASKQEKLAQVIEGVNAMYGGQAEAAAKGVGGVQLLRRAFDSIQEGIGERLAPAIELGTQKLTTFLRFIGDNKPVMDLVTSLLLGGIAATGIATAVGTAAIGFLKLRAAMIAAQVSTQSMSLAVKGLIGATGIGLLVVIASEIYLNWSTIWPRMSAIFQAFVDNVAGIGSGLALIMQGVFSLDTEKIKEGWAKVKQAYSDGVDQAAEEFTRLGQAEDKHYIEQDGKRAAAAARTRAQKEQEAADLAAIDDAQKEMALLKAQDYSNATLDLQKQELETLKAIKEEKNLEEREQLQAHLEDIRLLKEDQKAIDDEQRVLFEEEYLAKNEEFQAMTEEQQQAFLLRNQEALQGQILTEQTAREKALKDRLKQQIDSNNQFLLEQQKFGTAYAMINQIMHSEIYKGSKQAFGELAQLQSSSNATLKAIGKTAAIANIIIKTAESAMNIYAGFATIPIIGPALGIAGAAAAVAFGAEQVGKVNGAAEGGLLRGGIPGRDSIPVMAQDMELVSPAQNFEEVIGSVAATRAAEKFGAPLGGGDNTEMVSLLRSIDEKLSVPVQQTVIQGDFIGEDSFIDNLIRRMNERLEFGNVRLYQAEA